MTAQTDYTPATVLEIHERVWDMPTLAAQYPDVIEWLAARYEVHFGIVSDVIIVDRATNRPTFHNTTDVRVALAATLRAA